MKKYNNQLFFAGFLLNIIRKFPLVLIAVILGIVGIWVKACLFAALGIVVLVIIWSLVEQILIKNSVENNENPDFAPFAEAMMSENWRDDIKELVEDKLDENTDAQ